MTQTNLDDLVNKCLKFTDKNGRVINKGGNPVSSFLEMEYIDNHINIYFRVQSSAYSNGSSLIKILENGEVVLDAQGKFMTSAFEVKANTYVSGEWEKYILNNSKAHGRNHYPRRN